MKHNFMASLVLFGLFLCACAPLQPASPSPARWNYHNLRQIDPLDTALPGQDLVAAYSRLDGQRLEVRLDFLDLDDLPDFDVYLAFDQAEGGSRTLPIQATTNLDWDSLLVIPAQSPIQAYRAGTNGDHNPTLPGSAVRVLRDPLYDTLIISLNREALEGESSLERPLVAGSLEIFLTPAGASQVIDRLAPFRLNQPPPAQVQVILAFWNSLPVSTPLQALRRWDGAHTGPLGGRHGLSNLLRTAQSAGAPLFLLDLNQPAGLAALDAVGGLEITRQMLAQDLLALPTSLPGFLNALPSEQPPAWMLEKALVENMKLSQMFGLSNSRMVYLPGGIGSLTGLTEVMPDKPVTTVFLPASYDQATSIPVTEDFSRWQGLTIVTLPEASQIDAEAQIDADGLTLASRRALVEAALPTGQDTPSDLPQLRPGGELLALGGELPSSAWGNPLAARAAFEYLQSRPWIRLVRPSDLLNALPRADLQIDGLEKVAQASGWPSGLEQALQDVDPIHPENEAILSAWQAVRAVYAPAYPFSAELPALRRQTIGQVGLLMKAGRWAEHPGELASCQEDLDQDGQSECVLASEQVFAVFELDLGGYLALLFARDSDGQLHQLVGSSTLLTSGAGPPEEWDLTRGILADSQTLPGAFFSHASGSSAVALVSLTETGLTLTDASSGLKKTFQLHPKGLDVYISQLPAGQVYQTVLPLMLDPWQRFKPGWVDDYQAMQDGRRLVWKILNGPGLEIRTNAESSLTDWSSGIALLGQPEDPNRDIPAGFRLPWPLVALTLSATDELSMTIRLIE